MSQPIPGAPDNPAAAKALQEMLAAGQRFLAAEQDQGDRQIVARVLAALHALGSARATQAAGPPPALIRALATQPRS